jgi:hypothetical protein
MSRKSRTGLLISLGAAAGAFGVAATMSAVSAPTARADDFSDIITQVEDDFGFGQTAFNSAESTFATDPSAGLTDLVDGINDDFLSAPQDFLAGTSEAADNETLGFVGSWDLATPSSFSEGLAAAEDDLEDALTLDSAGIQELARGDYGYAAYYDLLGSDYSSILPLEEILLGLGSSS